MGYLKDMFELSKDTRGRGHEHKLIVEHSRTRLKKRQSFFSRRVVGQWNDLPGDIAGAASLVSFKNKLDEYFTTKGFCLQIFLGLTFSIISIIIRESSYRYDIERYRYVKQICYM